MRPILLYLLLLLLSVAAQAQSEAPRLIVRGDDMGYTHSGNEALIYCYQEGIETSIEVIVPSPWFPEAVKLLKENPQVDVGVHLALTSEWDNAKWRPLSDCPSLKDQYGYFYPMVSPNENYPGQSIAENAWTIEDVEREFRAQIETAMDAIPGISHVSGHVGCSNLNEEVQTLTETLGEEYGLLVSPDVTYLRGFNGNRKTPEEKIESLLTMLDTLKAGQTYLFVEHPGFDNEELRAIHHIGYENVAADRQGVTDLFTSDKVKAFIKQKGIQLIGYRDLATP